MSVPRSRGLALVLASSVIVTACASVPDLGTRPEMRTAEQFASTRSLSSGTGEWPSEQWWAQYGDPQLDRLMREALAGSPDLEAAAARLRIAQAFAQQANAALQPTLDLTANAGAVKQSENNGVPAAFVPQGWQDTGKIGLSLALDLDLWGKNRAALAGAQSDAAAARYELEEARLVLTTGIATAYADLARLHAQHDVLAATLANREATLRLVASRVEAGLDNQAALKQAQSRVPAARAELAASEEAIALTRNLIAALTGAGPDRGQIITRPTVSLRQARGVPAGAAIELVGRRPDIAAARSAVEAAASRIKVARASFYPNISLTGLIGLQALGLNNLLGGGSAFGNVGPAVSLPIFRGGELQGQYRGARGRYDEAVARYDGIVVQALRQVADTLVSRNALASRLGETRQSLAAAEQAYALARTRYERGLAGYLDVLTTEEGVLQARRSVAELEARAFTLDIAMVRTLGGGFSAA